MTTTTQSQQHFGVSTDYEYRVDHKRDRIVVWSGPFFETFEAEGLSLPNDAGYMLTTYNGDKLRVECPAPRDGENYDEVDRLIGSALGAHYLAIGAKQVMEPVTPESTPITASIPVVVTSQRRRRPARVKEPVDRVRKPRRWLARVAIGACLVLIAVDFLLASLALTIDSWWKP